MTRPEQPALTGAPQQREPAAPTPSDLEEAVITNARALALSLREATDAGVGPARLLPALVLVFRDAGLFNGSVVDVLRMQQQLPGGEG